MKINGKEYLNPQQQLVENTKDIEELKNIIKPEYKTEATLTNSSTCVAIADTNAPEGTTEGWLLTEDGLKFKITGGDETNLLLVFYADLKGPQGEDGAAVNIDDNITSPTKVWSSQKTNNEITGLINDSTPSATKVWSSSKVSSLLSDGIYWTSSEPTLVGAEYRISGFIYCGADIINPSEAPGLTDNILKAGDMIAYVDNDGKIASIWYYISGSAPKVVAKVGDIGGGKQLYQHCITLKDTYDLSWVRLTIVNNDDTSFTISTFNQWLADKGYTSTSNLFRCVSGTILDSSTFYNAVKGIFLSSNQPRAVYYIATNNISGYSFDQIKDDVFPL